MNTRQENHPNLVKPAAYPGASARRAKPPPYTSLSPKPFKEIEQRHTRAVVWPWKPVQEAWNALKFSLRSVHTFFEDQECPLYVIGASAPNWLKKTGRVTHVPISSYDGALAFGVQVADEVVWMNDDIYLLRPTSWDDMRVALTEGTLDEFEDELRKPGNVWRRLLGDACAELRKRGHGPVWRFSTHTPYLYEREKALEILRAFYITHKTPFETLYHNYHHAPHESCEPHKATILPTRGNPRYCNNGPNGPSPSTQDELRRLLSTKPPWES